MSSRINISRLSHITYYHTDLDKMRVFNRDFGFEMLQDDGDRIYWAGYGPDAYCQVTVKSDKIAFGGASWLAASRDDLVKATQIPGAGAIEKLTGPGGGEQVAFMDYFGKPGFVVFGIQEKTPAAQAKLTLNYPEEKVRCNDFQRFEQGPAKINKLGHWGYVTGDFAGGSAWYRDTFNLRYSDVMEHELPNGKVEEHGAFFRLDKKAEFVDHHCFFLLSGPPGTKTVLHHSSYEVSDYDQQNLGHAWLQSKSYELSWGLGRHVLGSQIFDYWFDPTGFRVEHYADGDWLNDTKETGVHRTAFGAPPQEEDLAVWAQEPMTPAFVEIRAA
ncbi:hypothetical protein RQP46_011437 [Phenoliferia psychrophenolica]